MRQYTAIVAEEIGCPEWIEKSLRGESTPYCNRDDKDEVCYCQAAAWRIIKLHDTEIMEKVRKVML